MHVYINSCGVAPEHDYRWRYLGDGSQTDPPLLDTQQIKGLREDGRFTLVLAREGERLGVLVAGLETADRSDALRRKITNTLACLGEITEEPMLRGIAVTALNGTLASLMDEAVQSRAEDSLGFVVAADLVNRLAELRADGDDAPHQLANQLGKNSELLRQDLADELNLHRLPERDGVLVVVTALIAPQKFVQAQVWRGLSDLVGNEGDLWTLLPLSSKDPNFGRLGQRFTLLKSFCGWLHTSLFVSKQKTEEKLDRQK